MVGINVIYCWRLKQGMIGRVGMYHREVRGIHKTFKLGKLEGGISAYA